MDLCLSGLDTFLVFFSAEDATCSSAVAALVVASLSFLLPTIAVVSDVVGVGGVVVVVKEECLSPIMC